MISTIRTNSSNPDFIELVKELDKDLAERDGNEHAFYAQYNGIENIKYVVVAYEDDKVIGCGAIKKVGKESMEVKRMYTTPTNRGKGIASIVLNELEKWAVELSAKRCILETSVKQPEAIALYNKNGYGLIPNYGQYKRVENSRCFSKDLQ